MNKLACTLAYNLLKTAATRLDTMLARGQITTQQYNAAINTMRTQGVDPLAATQRGRGAIPAPRAVPAGVDATRSGWKRALGDPMRSQIDQGGTSNPVATTQHNYAQQRIAQRGPGAMHPSQVRAAYLGGVGPKGALPLPGSGIQSQLATSGNAARAGSGPGAWIANRWGRLGRFGKGAVIAGGVLAAYKLLGGGGSQPQQQYPQYPQYPQYQ